MLACFGAEAHRDLVRIRRGVVVAEQHLVAGVTGSSMRVSMAMVNVSTIGPGSGGSGFRTNASAVGLLADARVHREGEAVGGRVEAVGAVAVRERSRAALLEGVRRVAGELMRVDDLRPGPGEA